MALAWLNTLRSYLCGGNAVNKADLLEAFFTQSQAHFPPGIDFLMDNFKCIPSFIDLILQIEVHIAAESFHLHADESRQLVDNSSYKYLIHILLQSGCRNPSCTCSFAVCDDRNGLNRISLLKWHKKKQVFVFLFNAHLQAASVHSGKLWHPLWIQQYHTLFETSVLQCPYPEWSFWIWPDQVGKWHRCNHLHQSVSASFLQPFPYCLSRSEERSFGELQVKHTQITTLVFKSTKIVYVLDTFKLNKNSG